MRSLRLAACLEPNWSNTNRRPESLPRTFQGSRRKEQNLPETHTGLPTRRFRRAHCGAATAMEAKNCSSHFLRCAHFCHVGRQMELKSRLLEVRRQITGQVM